MSLLAGIGIGLLVVAALLVVLGAVLTLTRALRVRRVLRETQALAVAYRLVVGITSLELRLMELERHELLRPWRRVRRWVTHPLLVAIAESWARRRRRAREARLEAVRST